VVFWRRTQLLYPADPDGLIVGRFDFDRQLPGVVKES
jgi:hypothetical protein